MIADGCASGSGSTACEPNLPTVPMSDVLPNVLIVGDSISHGYFPVLRARLNGTVAALQHAPSNTGAMPAGVECWNISTALGASGDLPKPWDLVRNLSVFPPSAFQKKKAELTLCLAIS